jgi:hypothetical protein
MDEEDGGGVESTVEEVAGEMEEVVRVSTFWGGKSNL